jgi:hypothetical protein
MGQFATRSKMLKEEEGKEVEEGEHRLCNWFPRLLVTVALGPVNSATNSQAVWLVVS